MDCLPRLRGRGLQGCGDDGTVRTLRDNRIDPDRGRVLMSDEDEYDGPLMVEGTPRVSNDVIQPTSDYQKNLLRRAESRKKIAPPESIPMTPREANIRMVADTLVESNGWSLAYAIRQVRRVIGDEGEPFRAIE